MRASLSRADRSFRGFAFIGPISFDHLLSCESLPFLSKPAGTPGEVLDDCPPNPFENETKYPSVVKIGAYGKTIIHVNRSYALVNLCGAYWVWKQVAPVPEKWPSPPSMR
jgi:hypothetical protein